MRYDVIVIGAGSGGGAVAGRLAQDPNCSVLLLEAGPDYPDIDHLPEGIRDGTMATEATTDPHVWRYLAKVNDTQPDPMLVIYGKVTGGSSAVNGAVFLRGAPEDYDDWAPWGKEEWAYEKVLPYFRKLETDLDFGGDFHGKDGPISIRRVPYDALLPSQTAFYQACLVAGFPADPDQNLPDTTGIGIRPINEVGGLRISTAVAYLNPNRYRPNLTIRGKTTAQRILFEGRRVRAVEVESEGEIFRIEGDQIVLSAGVIQSAALLLHSGVGPAEELRALDIDVIHDLSGVGKNLRDHPIIAPLRQGPGKALGELGIWFRLREGRKEAPAPIQVGLRYTATGSKIRNDVSIGPKGGLFIDGVAHTRFQIILEKPCSVGRLTLGSSDRRIQPVLDYQLLMNPWDRERMREAVRLVAQLGETDPFRDHFAERVTPKEQDLANDHILDQWLLTNVTTSFHATGTCKMGPTSDNLAVVDQYCRVHGLDGLWVADASVMPDIIRANPNATIVMIAERVANWIKELAS